MISGRVIVRMNDLPNIAGRIEDRVQDALNLAVLATIEVADPLTRRDTGALVGNKTIENDGERAAVFWNQEYAAFQEYGTYKMSGTHYASNGAEAGAQALIAALRGMI